MSNYDFSTLNDKDFEEIICDLLSAELDIPFQSFKAGKDGGVDLKYSTEANDNEIVVQVKHYINTPKTEFFRKLKTQELDNLRSLKPERYIVATSILLNPEDKKKIKENLKPYVKSSQDIYGRNELNKLLRKHDSIEDKHFKLWFNNTKVLSKILNNGISGRSEFVADKIKKNIGLFVKTESFDEARSILNKERVLLITGIPGIGKTTLSYILSYYFLAQGFELIFCENDFSEAESVIGDPKKKQIFLFDDFLGDSYLEIQSGKNKTINSFIERIRISKNKFMILTTRTTILKQAQEIHEKIDRINFNSNKFELKISDYNELHKAQILYNHLFFLNVNKGYIKELLNDKSYLTIIRHGSYNPRLLEFITNTEHFVADDFEGSYLRFCLHNLDFPKAVWEKPFLNQLDLYERDILFCLLSLGRSVLYEDLEKVFNEKINFDIQHNRKQYKANSFITSFKILLTAT
jgi:DNA polymerase III delta prime subunit